MKREYKLRYKIILAAIILNKEGKILLSKRAREPFQGKWSIPGGFGALEKNQNPFKAIKKEMKDDFGEQFVGDFYTISYEKQPEPTIKLFFIGRLLKNPSKLDEITISEAKWFDLKEALRIDLAFKDKEILKKFYARQNKSNEHHYIFKLKKS